VSRFKLGDEVVAQYGTRADGQRVISVVTAVLPNGNVTANGEDFDGLTGRGLLCGGTPDNYRAIHSEWYEHIAIAGLKGGVDP
jgi:hypothetical protein